MMLIMMQRKAQYIIFVLAVTWGWRQLWSVILPQALSPSFARTCSRLVDQIAGRHAAVVVAAASCPGVFNATPSFPEQNQ